MQRRQPPHNLEIEKAALGALFLDPAAISTAAERVGLDDFYSEAHRTIFGAMIELLEKGSPEEIDWQMVALRLKESGKLEAAGGSAYIGDLIDATPSAANVAHYLRILGEYGVVRRLLGTAQEICDQCYEGLPQEIDGFLDETAGTILRVCESRIRRDHVTMHDLMVTSFKTVEALYDRKEALTGIPTGFPDLDVITSGFQDTDLIIIAGRPGMGKTSLALNVGLNAALNHGVGTAIFSLEMGADQLGMRILCSVARVNLKSLRGGFLSDADWSRLTLAVGKVSDAPVLIDDSASLTALQLRGKARRIQQQYGLGLIIVDYLQLMKAGVGARDSREREIADITRSLKGLAKELHVPVIALSQLNRKVEERADKRPGLPDLRESGAIEQDADVIIFVYRDEVYNKSPDNPNAGIAEIIVEKQRNGPTGYIKARFDGRTTTFYPLSPRDDDTVMDRI